MWWVRLSPCGIMIPTRISESTDPATRSPSRSPTETGVRTTPTSKASGGGPEIPRHCFPLAGRGEGVAGPAWPGIESPRRMGSAWATA